MGKHFVAIFLSSLKKNNNKEWFEANRKEYETSKKWFEELVEKLIAGIEKFDKGVVGLKPKDCLFRINRDVRFGKDKSPYKSNFGAAIAQGGRKSPYGGYYIHIEPGASFIAGGIHMPEPEVLKNIRQEIDYNFKDFNKIISSKSFIKNFGKLSGEKLVKVPKGYEETNPAAEILKHKHFVVMHKFGDDFFDDKNIDKYIVSVFKEIYPLNNFLNKALE